MNNLEKAEQILKDYSELNSLIDSGNLFFAANEFRLAYLETKTRFDQLLLQIGKVAKAINEEPK